MLKELYLKNVGLIKEAHIPFELGLCAITGATGAGKSMLLDAILLVLGERADVGQVGNFGPKAIIEAVFTPTPQGLKDILEREDIDLNMEGVHLRREISAQGKSRSFINDTPVNLTVLREAGTFLADIHTQHAQMALSDPAFSGLLLDASYQDNQPCMAYQAAFREQKRLEKKWDETQVALEKYRQDEDYIRFQLEEISTFHPAVGEWEPLKNEQERLSQAAQIQEQISNVMGLFSWHENPISDTLRVVEKNLQIASRQLQELEPLIHRIAQIRFEVTDIIQTLQDHYDHCQEDPERLEYIQQRISEWQRLSKKHRLENPEELFERWEYYKSQLSEFQEFDQKVDHLKQELEAARRITKEKAAILEEKRLSGIPLTEAGISSLFHKIGLQKAQLQFRLKPLTADQWTFLQPHQIDLYFSANPGVEPAILHKAASGGELSRIVLSMKTWLSGFQGIPTLVFDEIDAGISGDIARQVAETLLATAQGQQVIAITHMPQIAAKANHHIKVEKQTDGQTTITSVCVLDSEARVKELAEMIAGKDFTETAEKAAREFLAPDTSLQVQGPVPSQSRRNARLD